MQRLVNHHGCGACRRLLPFFREVTSTDEHDPGTSLGERQRLEPVALPGPAGVAKDDEAEILLAADPEVGQPLRERSIGVVPEIAEDLAAVGVAQPLRRLLEVLSMASRVRGSVISTRGHLVERGRPSASSAAEPVTPSTHTMTAPRETHEPERTGRMIGCLSPASRLAKREPV